MSAALSASRSSMALLPWIDPIDDEWWTRAVEQFGLERFLAPAHATIPASPTELSAYEEDLDRHDRHERLILWKEFGSVAFVTTIVVARQLWFS